MSLTCLFYFRYSENINYTLHLYSLGGQKLCTPLFFIFETLCTHMFFKDTSRSKSEQRVCEMCQIERTECKMLKNLNSKCKSVINLK